MVLRSSREALLINVCDPLYSLAKHCERQEAIKRLIKQLPDSRHKSKILGRHMRSMVHVRDTGIVWGLQKLLLHHGTFMSCRSPMTASRRLWFGVGSINVTRHCFEGRPLKHRFGSDGKGEEMVKCVSFRDVPRLCRHNVKTDAIGGVWSVRGYRCK